MGRIPGITFVTDMPAEDLARFLMAFFGIIAGAIIIIAVTALVVYILQSLALYRMSKNAGYPSPILAWIPVASSYLLGLLCERASFRRAGKSWKFSVILPVLELLALFGTGSLRTMSFFSSTAFWDSSSFLFVFRSLFVLAGTAVTVYALYNLYWDYAQGKEVFYTVLSVIFGGLGQAVILFILRDRVPVSAQGTGCYGGFPGYPGGPAGTAPPYQSNGYTTGWAQPPQYPPHSQQSQYPPYPPYPQYPQDPKGPEDKNL